MDGVEERRNTVTTSEEEEEKGLDSCEEEEEGARSAKRNSDEKTGKNKKKRKRGTLMEPGTVEAAKKRGVCYLSRIPRHMDHVKLRHILSQNGDVERIYLVPENPSAQVNRKRAGGFRGTEFSEGWVEFAKKSVAKKVAKLLNGEQMGGKRRSAFYYDLWNIKYLRKFKWDDLTEEIAYKSAIREQKLALEISAAKRERDFYLSKVDQSRALISMKERAEKKQKQEDTESGGAEVNDKPEPRFIRQFPQNRPVVKACDSKKPGLPKDILAGVFGRSSS